MGCFSNVPSEDQCGPYCNALHSCCRKLCQVFGVLLAPNLWFLMKKKCLWIYVMVWPTLCQNTVQTSVILLWLQWLTWTCHFFYGILSVNESFFFSIKSDLFFNFPFKCYFFGKFFLKRKLLQCSCCCMRQIFNTKVNMKMFLIFFINVILLANFQDKVFNLKICLLFNNQHFISFIDISFDRFFLLMCRFP